MNHGEKPEDLDDLEQPAQLQYAERLDDPEHPRPFHLTDCVWGGGWVGGWVGEWVRASARARWLAYRVCVNLTFSLEHTKILCTQA